MNTTGIFMINGTTQAINTLSSSITTTECRSWCIEQNFTHDFRFQWLIITAFMLLTVVNWLRKNKEVFDKATKKDPIVSAETLLEFGYYVVWLNLFFYLTMTLFEIKGWLPIGW